MPRSEAFCPAGISSFFEVCDHDEAGNALEDPARIGARGGGFATTRGVTCSVSAKSQSRTQIQVGINSKQFPNATTTRSAVERLLEVAGVHADVRATIQVDVPIAAGFGTSAAGTLATCLALSDALKLPLTFNELGRITHIAEVINGTGLGTVSALLSGGFVLVTEPGAPGIGRVDRLRFPPNHSVVCAHLGPILTRDVLAKRANGNGNEAAKTTLDNILMKPTLPIFLAEARKFGRKSGLETARVTRLISTMMAAGAVGAAQNMIGEAVHAVADDSKVTRILGEVKRVFPDAKVFASPLDNRGVRLLRAKAKH